MNKKKSITVEGRDFHINFFQNPLLAMDLDYEVSLICSEALGGGISSFASLLDQDMGAMTKAVIHAFRSLSGDKLHEFTLKMCSCVQAITPEGAKELGDPESFAVAFRGLPPKAIYEVLIHVMMHNRFTPFELVGGWDLKELGNLYNVISTGMKDEIKELLGGKKSESSENSPENSENTGPTGESSLKQEGRQESSTRGRLKR